MKAPFVPSHYFQQVVLQYFLILSNSVFVSRLFLCFICIYFLCLNCKSSESYMYTRNCREGKKQPGNNLKSFSLSIKENPPLISEGLFFKDLRGKNSRAKSNVWFLSFLSFLVSYSWWPFFLFSFK